jgi:membrane protein YdbS with pleckstrin-like domain
MFSAIPTAIDAGLYAFVDITKASLIAITASLILGAVISIYIAPKNL